jgi:V/A-type H+-transporting ATPase subunit B
MSAKEYRTAAAARGGLLIVKGVPGVAFGDRVQIRDESGKQRNGQVIRCSDEEVLVQVYEGTDDISLEATWVRFLDEPLQMALSPEILGRIFNGIGEPKDGRPPIVSNIVRPVAAGAINPSARTYPKSNWDIYY